MFIVGDGILLRIVTGGLRTDKFGMMQKYISKAVSEKRPVYIIIPDQFSYEYDKKLYKELGAKDFNSIKIVSFNRLSEEIIKNNGSESGEYIDDNTKQIMMYLAIKKLKTSKTSQYFKKQLDKPNFISSTLDLVKDLRQSDITPEDFQTASLSVTGSLSEKVNDLNQIYFNYSNILKEKELKDSLTIITEAAENALKNKHFHGFDVFIDEFSGFSFDELKMIETIISQADNLCVCLTISEENNNKTKLTPFSNVIKTQQALVELAKQHNISVDFSKCIEFNQYRAREIEHINKNIFSPIKNKCDTSENVEIVSSSDLYEEIEYVATEIKRIVCDKGYKYSEIAVVSRQLSDYFSIISGTFERYEIPYFMDTRQAVSQKALILFIMSIFETVTTKNYNTETILRYIKSTLSKFNDTQISKIEDYCYQWNVNGKMWLSDFTAQEKNLAQKEDGNGKTYLEKLNVLRKDIIEPLDNFKKASINSTAGQICEEFYCLLEKINISSTISNCIKNGLNNTFKNENDIVEISREFKQLWRILLNSVQSIYNNIGDENISLKEFYELLKLMISQTTVATPPQKLDAVMVASAERSRLANPKVVFVIGVNEGIMPYNVKESGLFTDKDKEMLAKAGLKISKTILWKIAEERFVAYQALCSPSDKLYVTFPTSSITGGLRRPSVLVSQIKNMFDEKIVSNAGGKSPIYFCTTAHSTYYKYIENLKTKSCEIASIKDVLNKIPKYNEKIKYLENISESPIHFCSEINSEKMFSTKNLSISATRLENYFKCPFNYFCQYGLNLKPTKSVEINPISRGTIVHYCLENIMSITDKSGKKTYNVNFTKLTDEELKARILMLLISFQKNELGGDFGKTNRFKALFERFNDMIFEVVKNIQNELKQSDFVPCDFELNLTDENGKSILEIELDNGIKIRINGKIDRVDIFEKNGKKYIRIVDYKTGDKDLLFEELYNGINLQMILYLLSLTKSNSFDGKYSDSDPAGVLYMPAKYLPATIEREFDILDNENIEVGLSKKIENEKLKNFKMKGLVVDICEIYQAMEKELKGQFIPVEAKTNGELKKNSKIIDLKAYKKLEEFAIGKVKEMAESLKKGEIKAVPTGMEKSLLCNYCDYWSVCGNYLTSEANIITKDDGDKLREIIGMNVENEAGDSNE